MTKTIETNSYGVLVGLFLRSEKETTKQNANLSFAQLFLMGCHRSIYACTTKCTVGPFARHFESYCSVYTVGMWNFCGKLIFIPFKKRFI